MAGAPRLLDRCAVARCRRDEAMRYEGKPVCWECWSYLTKDGDSSAALRRALGLDRSMRRTSGAAVNPEPAGVSPQGALVGSLAAVERA